jgi:transcriptional regulator with PAS, ATPase and Fis domain
VNGESGTGKELIARALHRLSTRSNRRFVAINCSAIPENLLESELFGYVKGAFTGAESKRKGYFEEAAGGTIFLDEIGDMPARLQAKLLRVLQEKQFTPIGSSEVKPANVRIVAATNINLEDAVRRQDFRLDLFYRLNVLPIRVPSLKERREDIRLLLEHFFSIANEQHAIANPCYLTPESLHALEIHDWPGNVRELQNLVERLVIMNGGGAIHMWDLPQEYQHRAPKPRFQDHNAETRVPLSNEFEPNMDLDGEDTSSNLMFRQRDNLIEGCQIEVKDLLPEDGLDLTKYIEELENSLILQALERTGYNKNRAAKLLGLNRTTLVERIKKRQLAPLNSPSKEL